MQDDRAEGNSHRERLSEMESFIDSIKWLSDSPNSSIAMREAREMGRNDPFCVGDIVY